MVFYRLYLSDCDVGASIHVGCYNSYEAQKMADYFSDNFQWDCGIAWCWSEVVGERVVYISAHQKDRCSMRDRELSKIRSLIMDYAILRGKEMYVLANIIVDGGDISSEVLDEFDGLFEQYNQIQRMKMWRNALKILCKIPLFIRHPYDTIEIWYFGKSSLDFKREAEMEVLKKATDDFDEANKVIIQLTEEKPGGE